MIQTQKTCDTIAKSWTLFRTIEICNMKSIRWTKLKKMAKNLFFGPLDHSKMHFLIFEWSIMSKMIAKLLRPFGIIKICNMKSIRSIKVEKMARNWMDHSKQPTRRTPKNVETEREFSRTCGFRGVAQKWMFYHIKA